MEPIIRALLAKLIGPKAQAIPIMSNAVETSQEGTWKIIFRDESCILPISIQAVDEVSGMTSLELLSHMRHFQQMDGRFWFIVEMVYQISVQQGKLIYYLRKRERI